MYNAPRGFDWKGEMATSISRLDPELHQARSQIFQIINSLQAGIEAKDWQEQLLALAPFDHGNGYASVRSEIRQWEIYTPEHSIRQPGITFHNIFTGKQFSYALTRKEKLAWKLWLIPIDEAKRERMYNVHTLLEVVRFALTYGLDNAAQQIMDFHVRETLAVKYAQEKMAA